MHDLPSAIELRAQLAAARARGSLREKIGNAAFRNQVLAVVDDCKAANCPSERIIIALKQIAEDAGLSSSRSIHTPESASDEDATIATIVQWSIEHYYASSTDTRI